MKTDTKTLNQNESFLTFFLGGEYFALPVRHVMEIMETGKITAIPNAPKTIEGIINFRGEVVPLVDMHHRFNCGGEKISKMIIIVDIHVEGKEVHVGLHVDDVTDVITLDKNEIRPAPQMGINYRDDFLDGIAEIDKKFIMVMNLEKVLDFNLVATGNAA